jgi:mRNA interferase RelE/StbE
MRYSLIFKPSATRQFLSLPANVQKRLGRRIEALASNPFPPDTKKLQSEPNTFRIRVGDYRVIYEVHGKILLVLVLRIGHRRDVYR